MSATNIEWTDVTWNPVRGCSRVSEGCRNCYAERVAARFSQNRKVKTGFGVLADGVGFEDYHYAAGAFEGFAIMTDSGPRWTGKVEPIESKLEEPLHWRKPRRVFVNSMSDLFHEELPDEAIDRVFAVMAMCPQHTFQVLTKRAERMREYLREIKRGELTQYGPLLLDPGMHPLSNVWLGVSVEDQETADERIPLLLQTPAAVRFVSYEPALGPVDFRKHLPRRMGLSEIPGAWLNDGCTEAYTSGLDWLICGGESGPGARPFDIAWARTVRDQCKAAGVPFFMKQTGRYPNGDGFPAAFDYRKRDRKGGDMDEWPEDLRIRESPKGVYS